MRLYFRLSKHKAELHKHDAGVLLSQNTFFGW